MADESSVKPVLITRNAQEKVIIYEEFNKLEHKAATPAVSRMLRVPSMRIFMS